MLGNVYEWVDKGILRGGSFSESAKTCRLASRLRGQGASNRKDKRFGFRLVLRKKN